MVKTLVFAGLNCTVHRFDRADNVYKSRDKTWWRWSGQLVENNIEKLCRQWTMRFRVQWICQCLSSSSLEPVLPIHCLAALDLGTGVEYPFHRLIIQNRQAVQTMQRSMEWTFEDKMVDGLFFCAILTSRRKGHTPSVQARTETSDYCAETVKPNPRCSRKSHSGR